MRHLVISISCSLYVILQPISGGTRYSILAFSYTINKDFYTIYI